jgi:hypothetical protein
VLNFVICNICKTVGGVTLKPGLVVVTVEKYAYEDG